MCSKHALNKVESTAPFTLSTPESAYSKGRHELTRCLPAASRTWHVKLSPGRGGYEDVADALGVASESAKRHVAVLGRQDHVLDGGHFEGVLLLLVERVRRDDRAEAASSPGGSGGAWDLDVPGNALGAATDDLFAKSMVIGPACPRQGRRGCCHRTSIAHRPSKTSMIFTMPLLRPLEFGLSAFTAAQTPVASVPVFGQYSVLGSGPVSKGVLQCRRLEKWISRVMAFSS
jgi:hypothetical protein